MATITYTLPNFPDGQQRTEQTSDGQPPENGNLDCVPRSIADGLTYLLGRTYDGDELKDAVHGQGWTGFQAASEYVAYCRAQGVRLFPVQGTPAALVTHTRAEIGAGHPVVGTIPSLWGLGRDGARAYCAQHGIDYTTHVVCFCGYGPGALRAANPWMPQWHDGDDAYWEADLEEGEVWVMERQEAIVVNVGGLEPGLAALAQQIGSDAASPETPLTAQGDTYARLANGGVIWWDAANKVGHTDQPAHVVAALEATIADLRRQLAAAKAAQAPAPTTSVPGVADLAQTVADAQSYRAVKAALALLLK